MEDLTAAIRRPQSDIPLVVVAAQVAGGGAAAGMGALAVGECDVAGRGVDDLRGGLRGSAGRGDGGLAEGDP